MKHVPFLVGDNLALAVNWFAKYIHNTANKILTDWCHDVVCFNNAHRPHMERRWIKFHHHDMVFEDFVNVSSCAVLKPHRGMHIGWLQPAYTDHERIDSNDFANRIARIDTFLKRFIRFHEDAPIAQQARRAVHGAAHVR